MSKSYLTRHEKDNVMKAAITKVWLEDELKEIQEKSPKRKLLITAFKYARTYINKLLVEMLDDKDQMQIRATIEDSKKYRFVMMARQDAMRKYAENEKSNEFVHVERKHQEQLIDIVLGSCGMCECKGKEVKNCRVRQTLIALDVDVVDANNVCGYRYGGDK